MLRLSPSLNLAQTREALAHIRAAGCPLVVALTKADLPQVREDSMIQCV